MFRFGKNRMSKEQRIQWEKDFIKRREERREEVRRRQNMTEEEKIQEKKWQKIMFAVGLVITSLGGFTIYTVINDILDKVYVLEETKEIDDKIKNY